MENTINVKSQRIHALLSQVEEIKQELSRLSEPPPPLYKVWVKGEEGIKTYFLNSCDERKIVLDTENKKTEILILYNNVTKQEILRIYYS